MMQPDNGNCSNCGTSFDGGGIWDHFYREFTEGSGYWMDEDGRYTENRRRLSSEEAEIVADEVAECYGATRTKGQWSRKLGNYDMMRDRITSYTCPDCGHTWA